jgi:hypothetical protein
LRGEAEAADGLIRATVGIGGRLESLRADPRAMRLGSEALCEEIMVAVNGALDDLQPGYPGMRRRYSTVNRSRPSRCGAARYGPYAVRTFTR